MTNPLKQAFEELKREEELKKKKRKKSLFNIRKEKRLSYYSGWHKDKLIEEEKTEKQTKLG